MTVITLGPEGTFSHELALRLGCDPVVLEPTIHSIFAGVAAGNGDGIVPIENSEAGGVGETLDGLTQYPSRSPRRCTCRSTTISPRSCRSIQSG